MELRNLSISPSKYSGALIHNVCLHFQIKSVSRKQVFYRSKFNAGYATHRTVSFVTFSKISTGCSAILLNQMELIRSSHCVYSELNPFLALCPRHFWNHHELVYFLRFASFLENLRGIQALRIRTAQCSTIKIAL